MAAGCKAAKRDESRGPEGQKVRSTHISSRGGCRREDGEAGRREGIKDICFGDQISETRQKWRNKETKVYC